MSRSALVCIFAAALWGAGSAAAQTVTPRSAALVAANCANCHGTHGRSSGAMPSLAGMPKEQLIDAMQQFRDGRREATVMHQLAKGYTVQEVEALAEHFARLERGR